MRFIVGEDYHSNKELRERLSAYIQYARDGVIYYDEKIKKFLELSILMLSFLLTISALLGQVSISDIHFFLVIIPALLIFGLNIYDYTKESRIELHNEEDWKTLWFYRGHNTDMIKQKEYREILLEEKNFFKYLDKEVKEDSLIEDDKKQLYLLYCYQAHYYKLAIRVRKTFFIGIISTMVAFFNMLNNLPLNFLTDAILIPINLLMFLRLRKDYIISKVKTNKDLKRKILIILSINSIVSLIMIFITFIIGLYYFA